MANLLLLLSALVSPCWCDEWPSYYFMPRDKVHYHYKDAKFIERRQVELEDVYYVNQLTVLYDTPEEKRQNSNIRHLVISDTQDPGTLWTVSKINDEGELFFHPGMDCWQGGDFSPEMCCNTADKKSFDQCWTPETRSYFPRCCYPHDVNFYNQAEQNFPKYDRIAWNMWKDKMRIGTNPPHELCYDYTNFDLWDTAGLWNLMERADIQIPAVGYINIGAADVDHDPLGKIIREKRLSGIAVEFNDTEADYITKRIANRVKDTRVISEWATPSNIQRLILEHKDLWPSDDQSRELFLLKLDIDSWECPLMEMALEVVSPYFIHMELNNNYPPPFKFAHLYTPKIDLEKIYDGYQFYPQAGCNLGYAADTLMKRGYYLLKLEPDSVWVRKDIAPLIEPFFAARFDPEGKMVSPPLRFPQDEMECFRKNSVFVTGLKMEQVRNWFFNAHLSPYDTIADMWSYLRQTLKDAGVAEMPVSLSL